MNNKVKLPRSSYEELCKIIKAYGHLQQPAPLDEISAISAIGRTNVSANNTFLSYANIIEGGNRKSITSIGRVLANALEHEITDDIPKAWREIVENNEFLNKMALAVKIRRGMEPSSLVSHIAYNAGEKKSKPAMTGARTVLDILRASELIKEEDGKLVPIVQSSQTSEEIDKETHLNLKVPMKEPISKIRDIQVLPTVSEGISVNIDVQIQATPSDLEDLAIKLKKFLKQLSENEEKDYDETEKD